MARSLDFLIIGAQKSASTFVHRALMDHPEIFMPPGEVNYFERSIYEETRPQQFEALFAEAGNNQRIGIKRPDYLALPECAERVASHSKGAKLIVVLRHPIQRALSAYYHYMSAAYFPIREPEEGLAAILDGRWSQYPGAETVLSYGRYGEALEKWRKHFSPAHIHVRLQEDLIADPTAEMDAIYRFLEISPDHVSANIGRRSQAVVYSLERARILSVWHRIARQWHPDRINHYPRFGKLSHWIYGAGRVFDRKVLSRVWKAERGAISAELSARLHDYYKEDLANLEELIGRDLTEWRRPVSEGDSSARVKHV